MGFFEKFGRKVEAFKRTAEETAADEATHVCRSCGERFYTDREACSECGAAVVARGSDSIGGSDPSDREASDDVGDDADVDSSDSSDGGTDGGDGPE